MISETRKLANTLRKAQAPFYVGVCVVCTGSVLLGRRTEDGIWTSPGGSGETGETPSQAALRELWEESNIVAREEELKELPCITAYNGKTVHCFLLTLHEKDSRMTNIHSKNDPDEETPGWTWMQSRDLAGLKMDKNRKATVMNGLMQYNGLAKTDKIPGGLADKKKPSDFPKDKLAAGIKVEMEHTSDPKIAEEIAMDHLTEDINYYKKLKTIEKSIVSNPLAYTDFNTAELAQEDLAQENSNWADKLHLLMLGEDFGAPPRDLDLPEMRKLYLSKVDDGVYSGLVKNNDDTSGNYGQVLVNLDKLPISSIIQALRSKEYLPKEPLDSLQEPMKESSSVPMGQPMGAISPMEESNLYKDDVQGLTSKLMEGRNGDVHIHIHKSQVSPQAEDLGDIIKGRKPMPVGTIRNWQGQNWVKHADGWVAIGGKSHGKLMGDSKGEVTHKEHADQYVDKEEKQEEESKTKEETLEEKHARELKALQDKHAAEKKAKEKKPKPEKPKEEAKTPPKEEVKLKPESKEEMDEYSKKVKELEDQGMTTSDAQGILMVEEIKARNERNKRNAQMIADMKAKAEAKEAAKTKKEEPVKNPAEDPREEAEKESEENKEDYANARDSKFSNKGEDLLGSARHKAMLWKGYEDSEKTGTADKLVNRDKLLKIDPLNITVDKDSALTDMLLHLAMQKFPAKPTSPYLKEAEGKADDEIAVVQRDGRYYSTAYYEKIKDKYIGSGRPAIFMKAGDIRKEARKAYYDTFQQMKKKLEELSPSIKGASLEESFGAIRLAVSDLIKERRKENRSDLGANLLASFHNKTLKVHRASSTSVIAAATAIAKTAQAREGNIADNLFEMAQQVAEGKKLSAITGNVASKEKGFTAADRYLSEAARKGPDSGLDSTEAQENFILKDSGMRGLQWGNSVTDEERAHHLKYVAESFKDLTEALGLPPEMGSFNGRLGLAIGARGKARAMAHYEPATNVINLTRKNGVGSLAHEWGHFFDKTLSDTHGLGGFLSAHKGSIEQSPVHKAMKDLMKSEEWQTYRTQVVAEIREMGAGLKAKYWLSDEEMFARAFEVHIDSKLKSKGRLNTYLAGVLPGGMWPTVELSQKMMPKFDAIFEEFKNSEHLKKALDMIVIAEKLKVNPNRV